MVQACFVLLSSVGRTLGRRKACSFCVLCLIGVDTTCNRISRLPVLFCGRCSLQARTLQRSGRTPSLHTIAEIIGQAKERERECRTHRERERER